MNCTNCGTVNENGSKFCIKCGSLIQSNSELSPETNNLNINQNITSPETTQLTNNQDYENSTNNTMMSKIDITQNKKMNIFSAILFILIQPFTTIKNNKEGLENTKNSMLLWLFTTSGATILNILSTICSLVIEKGWDNKIEFVWDNLEYFKFFEVFFKSILLFGIGIFLVAIIYFVIGAIYKRDTKLPTLIGISSLSFIPLILCSFLISPIMNYVYFEISIFITILGIIYTLLILSISMNNELKLENNDSKVFLNLIAITIIIIGSYFAYTKVLLGMSSEYGDFSDIFDMFDY